jgi:hypothetical protein
MVSGAKEKKMKLEIVRYNWQLVDGDPKIVISMVKVMEDDGTYIKFAKLKEIIDYLPDHPVSFRKLEKPSADENL